MRHSIPGGLSEPAAPLLLRRRQVLGAGGLMALGGLAAACGGQSGGSVSAKKPVAPKKDGNISFFTYSDYIAPSIVKDFESAYGVKVSLTYYESESDAIQKIAAGQSYDLVVMSSVFIPAMISSRLLLEVDPQKFSTFDQLLPFFRDPFYDPGSRHCVPYDVGPAGIAWRTDKVQNLTGSWSDLWLNKEVAKGHIFVWQDPGEAIGIALAHLGYSPYSGNPKQVAEAGQALSELLPYMAGFSDDDDPNMVEGRAWLEFAWTGDIYQALLVAKDPPPSVIKFELCKETQFFNSDNLIIPSTAQHPGTAALFMDWVLRPENVAKNVNYIGYPIPTNTGMSTYKELTRKYPFLDVGVDQMGSPSAWQQPLVGEKLQLYTETLTKVKAA